MRSEARLKLFTLDPDTQVMKIIPVSFTSATYWFHDKSLLLRQFMTFNNISCFHRNWISLALSQTCGSLKRSSGRESWSAVMTCLSTCRAVLQRMKRDQQLMYVSMKNKQILLKLLITICNCKYRNTLRETQLNTNSEKCPLANEGEV